MSLRLVRPIGSRKGRRPTAPDDVVPFDPSFVTEPLAVIGIPFDKCAVRCGPNRDSLMAIPDSATVFSGVANFANAYVAASAQFEGASFKGNAIFNGAKIDGPASFYGETNTTAATIFEAWADFRETTVGGTADFSGTTFSGLASFDRSHCNALADFRNAVFRNR